MIRLICLDLDGTLVQPVNFWMELHRRYGTLEEGKQLTERYLKTDYEMLIREVPGRLWKGKDEKEYLTLAKSIAYMQGIEEFFIALNDRFPGAPKAIISGGCYELAKRVQKDFGIDFIFANQLVMEEGKVSGRFHWPVGAGKEAKACIIEGLCDDLGIRADETLMIGDSEGDIEAFKIAGTSIAFNDAPASLCAVATHTVSGNDLRDIIPILDMIQGTK